MDLLKTTLYKIKKLITSEIHDYLDPQSELLLREFLNNNTCLSVVIINIIIPYYSFISAYIEKITLPKGCTYTTFINDEKLCIKHNMEQDWRDKMYSCLDNKIYTLNYQNRVPYYINIVFSNNKFILQRFGCSLEDIYICDYVFDSKKQTVQFKNINKMDTHFFDNLKTKKTLFDYWFSTTIYHNNIVYILYDIPRCRECSTLVTLNTINMHQKSTRIRFKYKSVILVENKIFMLRNQSHDIHVFNTANGKLTKWRYNHTNSKLFPFKIKYFKSYIFVLYLGFIEIYNLHGNYINLLLLDKIYSVLDLSVLDDIINVICENGILLKYTCKTLFTGF